MPKGYLGKNKPKLKNCVICKGKIDIQYKPNGAMYWDKGHNPWPVKDKGRCCTECNETKVIPTRFGFF